MPNVNIGTWAGGPPAGGRGLKCKETGGAEWGVGVEGGCECACV